MYASPVEDSSFRQQFHFLPVVGFSGPHPARLVERVNLYSLYSVSSRKPHLLEQPWCSGRGIHVDIEI